MKNGTLMLAALLMGNGTVFAQSEAEIRDRIVGTWKLVSTEQILKDGTTRPYPTYGSHGKGFLMYSRDGYMCADPVNPDRPRWVDPYIRPQSRRSPPPTAPLPTAGGMRLTRRITALSIYLKLPQDAAMKDRARSGRTSSKMAAWC